MSKDLYIFYLILSFWFYRGNDKWTCMNWLDLMSRGRGKKWDGKFEDLKSLHGKLKIIEIESYKCYGSRSENRERAFFLFEEIKMGNKIKFIINENKNNDMVANVA